MHGTTGSGAQFIRPEFAGELFGKDQAARRDEIFHRPFRTESVTEKSSKPSDGLHAKFPRYGYIDMIEAQYRLLTDALGVKSRRLVTGTSMGGMHSWLLGEGASGFMRTMPLASLPTQISGRNRAWRRNGDRRDSKRSGLDGGEYPRPRDNHRVFAPPRKALVDEQ